MKFSGIVKKNLGRGRQLGFPTANIDAPAEIEDGLYLGLSNNKPAIVFIGTPKTFDDNQRRAEIYILDFSGDLYGQQIEVELIKKIRDNQKFESGEALIAQMKEDERVAREFFKDYNLSN